MVHAWTGKAFQINKLHKQIKLLEETLAKNENDDIYFSDNESEYDDQDNFDCIETSSLSESLPEPESCISAYRANQ